MQQRRFARDSRRSPAARGDPSGPGRVASRRPGALWLALLLALLLGGGGGRVARAGNGLALIGQSPRSAARGGAGVAVWDGPLSIAHNPALMARADRPEIEGSLLALWERVRERNFFENQLTSTFQPFPVPLVAFAWDPFAEEAVIGGLPTQVPSDVRLGVGLFQPIGLVFAPTVSLSWQVSDRVSLGASLNVLLTYLNFDSNGSIGGGAGNEDYVPHGGIRVHYEADGTPVVPPDPFDAGTGQQITWAEVFDIVNNPPTGPPPPGTPPPDDSARTEIKIQDVFGAGIAAQLGLAWMPLDRFSIGLSARTPGIIFQPHGRGSLDLRAAVAALRNDPNVAQLIGVLIETYLPDRAQAGLKARYEVGTDRLEIPASISLGFAWWPFDRLLLSLDLRWIGWDGTFNSIDIVATGGENRDFNEINGGSTIRHRFRLDWSDQFVVALGASVAVTDTLAVRFGFNHGNNPVPGSTKAANSFVVEDHVTFGLGLRLGQWHVDGAYVYALPVEEQLPMTSFKAEQHTFYLGCGYEF